jgi:hypothetical protein
MGMKGSDKRWWHAVSGFSLWRKIPAQAEDNCAEINNKWICYTGPIDTGAVA